MVQEETNNQDGADEKMLGSNDSERLPVRGEQVTFIKADGQNGDAKIDIGDLNGKSFTGMTKDELMKYANDPFWVRLRWIFFIAFWAVWVAMLVAAIFIIIGSPKCAAPEPLSWYKSGILAQFKNFDFTDKDLAIVRQLQASGVIYELPPKSTYSVASNSEVESKVKELVHKYKGSGADVILDITANYVDNDSQFMKDALADESRRSAFIWVQKPEEPNNWLSIGGNVSAWSKLQTEDYVLSQFGDGHYDLLMSDPLVKRELIKNLQHLIKLGVRGIRLKNSKHFMISVNLENEAPANDPNFIHNQYGFWTHTHTTFQDGLGDVLYEYLTAVKNVSSDAFLSVADDVVRPEVYKTRHGDYGIDMPIYGRLTHFLYDSKDSSKLISELSNTMNTAGNTTWLQWVLDRETSRRPVIAAAGANPVPVGPSAVELFVSLLPGVPVISVDPSVYGNVSEESELYQNITAIYKHIRTLRQSKSYMYGDFEIFSSNDLVAYSRFKSGSPGYLVVFNPTTQTKTGNFTHSGLPDQMTVDTVSFNYNATLPKPKEKVVAGNLTVSPMATVILTYVGVE